MHASAARLLAGLSPDPGPLRIGGIAADDLAARFGTPLFVYDAGIARARLAAVRAAFGDRVQVLYALKANPCVRLARALREAGAGAELASAGEVVVARAAGFAGEAMQFAGPGKDEHDFEAALDAGVGTLNLESPAEYDALCRVAARRGARPGVAIRINPARPASGARVRMAGSGSKFGVDEDRVVAFAETIERDRVCTLRGVHMYAGSQAFDVDAWLAAAERAVEAARAIERALGRPLSSVGLGGGFGVPASDREPTFDVAHAGRGARDLIADAPAAQHFSIELGRWLVAECGVYLTRILYAKESAGRRHVIVDGGLHHFGAAAGLGAVIKRPYPIVACADPRAEGHEPVAGGGPLCTPADEFAAAAALPRVARGDLLAVLVAGAYGLTFSPIAFLSHPTPAEVVVDGGTALLARRRGRPEDVLRDQDFAGDGRNSIAPPGRK